VERNRVARFGAPAAFLAGVTVAVLLVRAGLESRGTTTPPGPTTHPAVTTTRPTTKKHTTTAAAEARYYVVQRGDTFGSIAAKAGTTVTQLEALNPGVSSNALHIGQRLRVK
jgi:LysM repeat protein